MQRILNFAIASAFSDTDGEFFGRKNFWPKFFFGRKVFRSKVFSAEKFFGRKIFGRKSFQPKKMFDRKKIRPKFFPAEQFSADFFSGRKIFRSKNSPSVSPKAEAMGGGGSPPRSVGRTSTYRPYRPGITKKKIS